jgi:hypothetical protein
MVKSIKPSAKNEKPCCAALNKLKTEIENCVTQLIESEDDFGKTKWAWGIIKTIEPLSGEKVSKGKKSFLCEKCESYIMPRKRLAELVILGSKG